MLHVATQTNYNNVEYLLQLYVWHVGVYINWNQGDIEIPTYDEVSFLSHGCKIAQELA